MTGQSRFWVLQVLNSMDEAQSGENSVSVAGKACKVENGYMECGDWGTWTQPHTAETNRILDVGQGKLAKFLQLLSKTVHNNTGNFVEAADCQLRFKVLGYRGRLIVEDVAPFTIRIEMSFKEIFTIISKVIFLWWFTGKISHWIKAISE